MEAGNTTETLASVDVSEAAPVIPEAPAPAPAPVAADPVPDTVSREEYNSLRDAFLRLVERIEKHNIGAPHKI